MPFARVVSIAFYLIGAWLPMWINVALFIRGWIFQFIGHSVYEHKQPVFFRNVVHLLIGPLWILNDVIPVVRELGVGCRSKGIYFVSPTVVRESEIIDGTDLEP